VRGIARREGAHRKHQASGSWMGARADDGRQSLQGLRAWHVRKGEGAGARHQQVDLSATAPTAVSRQRAPATVSGQQGTHSRQRAAKHPLQAVGSKAPPAVSGRQSTSCSQWAAKHPLLSAVSKAPPAVSGQQSTSCSQQSAPPAVSSQQSTPCSQQAAKHELQSAGSTPCSQRATGEHTHLTLRCEQESCLRGTRKAAQIERDLPSCAPSAARSARTHL